MAVEELQVVRLRDEFYRDGFYKVLIALVTIIVAIVFLIAISVYIYLSKPKPVNFSADNEWRIVAPVPINQEYLSTPDLIQWVSEAVRSLFNYDFINYDKQLPLNQLYFTPNGWKKFLDVVNVYANRATIQKSKTVVSSNAAGAPFILNRGLLNGAFSWWIQMPVDIDYNGNPNPESITMQILVVRVPTLNNLYGVAIENIIVVNNTPSGGQAHTNG